MLKHDKLLTTSPGINLTIGGMEGYCESFSKKLNIELEERTQQATTRRLRDPLIGKRRCKY